MFVSHFNCHNQIKKNKMARKITELLSFIKKAEDSPCTHSELVSEALILVMSDFERYNVLSNIDKSANHDAMSKLDRSNIERIVETCFETVHESSTNRGRKWLTGINDSIEQLNKAVKKLRTDGRSSGSCGAFDRTAVINAICTLLREHAVEDNCIFENDNERRSYLMSAGAVFEECEEASEEGEKEKEEGENIHKNKNEEVPPRVVQHHVRPAGESRPKKRIKPTLIN